MSPRIALSAVVLPAPLGPISPRIRPSSTHKSMSSSAMVGPKALRRPRASMHAMASALLLRSIGFCIRRRDAVGRALQQLFRLQAQALDGCVDPGPFVGQKLLALSLEQQSARAGFDEHAQAPPLLDQLFVHQ